MKNDDDIARICAEILEDPETMIVNEKLINASHEWANKIRACFVVDGCLNAIDESRIERGRLLWLDWMECHREIANSERFPVTESGCREHPAGSAGRAYSNQMKDWEDKMLKRLEEMPVGGQASHGNNKGENKALDFIRKVK